MNREQVTIRPLGYSDLPQVIAIERRAFPTPWSLAMFVLELSKPSSVCLAAVKRGQDQGAGQWRAPAMVDGKDSSRADRLVGYLLCARYADAWHLMNVAVDPSAQRQGIGTALIAEMLTRAGPEQPYTLEVRPSNAVAISLYERFGFRSAGRRRRYYRDTGEDALVMWRTEAACASRTHR